MTQKEIKRNSAIRELTKEYLKQAGYGTGVFVPLNVYQTHENDATSQIDEWILENSHELQRFGLFDQNKWDKEVQQVKTNLNKNLVNSQNVLLLAQQGKKLSVIVTKIDSINSSINKLKNLDKVLKKVHNLNNILDEIDENLSNAQGIAQTTSRSRPGPIPPTPSTSYSPDWKTYLKESWKTTNKISHTTKNFASEIKHGLKDTFRVSHVEGLFGHKASHGLFGKTFGTSANLLGGSLNITGNSINSISSLTGSTFKLAMNMTSLTASFIPKYGNVIAQGIDIFGSTINSAFSLFGKISGKALSAVGGLLGGLISTIGKLASAPGNALASNSTIGSIASMGGLLWMLGGMGKGTFAHGLGDVFKGGFSFDKLTKLPMDSLLDTTSLVGGALSMVPGMEGTGLSMMIVPQIIKAIKNNFDGIKSFFDEQLKKFFGDTEDQWNTRKEEWSSKFNEYFTTSERVWNGLKDIFNILLTWNDDKKAKENERNFVDQKNNLKTFLVDKNFISDKDTNVDNFKQEDLSLIANSPEGKQSFVDSLMKINKERNPNKSPQYYEYVKKQLEEKVDVFKSPQVENKNTTISSHYEAKEVPVTNVWKMNKPEEGNFKLKENETPFINPGAGTHLEKLNPEFYNRFLAAATEYYNKTGKKVKISDGWRSYDEQVKLKNDKPGLAAKPGTSMHGYGMAMDIDSNMANEMASLGIFDKFGINRPMLSKKPGEKYEPWHIEPVGLDKIGLKKSGPSGLKSGSEYSNFLGKSNLPQSTYKERDIVNTSSKSSSMIESLLGTGKEMFDVLQSDEFMKSILGQIKKDVTPTSQDIEEYERKINLPKSNNGFNAALDKITKPLTEGLMEQLKGIQGSLTSVNQTFIQQDSTRDNNIKIDSQESMIMINANILTV